MGHLSAGRVVIATHSQCCHFIIIEQIVAYGDVVSHCACIFTTHLYTITISVADIMFKQYITRTISIQTTAGSIGRQAIVNGIAHLSVSCLIQ